MLYGYVENTTFQWGLIDGLATAKGLEAATDSGRASHLKNITLRNSIIAHCVQASPSLFADGPFHVVNNLVYDWKNFGTAIQNMGAGTRVNLIGNQYITGPTTNKSRYAVGMEGTMNPSGYIYVSDNIGPFRPSLNYAEWAIVGSGYGSGNNYWTQPASSSLRRTLPWPNSPIPVTPQSSSKAKSDVLSLAGATAPSRSTVDANVIKEINRGNASMSLSKLADLPRSTNAPTDTDKDGMPDNWEKSQNLNPRNASDARLPHRSGSGYTNLEEYLNPSSR